MLGHHFFNVYALGNNILQNIGIAVVNAQRDSESNEVSMISCFVFKDINIKRF